MELLKKIQPWVLTLSEIALIKEYVSEISTKKKKNNSVEPKSKGVIKLSL